MRKSFVVALCAVALIAPFAGTAAAHHEEDGAYEVEIGVDTDAGPTGLTSQHYPDADDRSWSGPWIDYVFREHLCHAPAGVECRSIPDDDPETVNPPGPDLGPSPLPPPPFLF